jgi:hypothetical protein
MNNTIKCKYCGKEIEISEALQHKIEEQALVAERAKHQKELTDAIKQAEQKAFERLQKDYALRLKNLEREKEEEKERNSKLLKQLEELSEEIRRLRRKDEERELEMKKRLADEEEKIRENARKKAFEEHELKDKEKDKKLSDALGQIEVLKAKIQRGSQQTQGEVMEVEIEEILKREFPDDDIEEIKKGQRGADVLQKVIDKKGRGCGSILWESKNAKWTEEWLAKLREDQRQAKAQLGVLVTSDPPKEIDTFTYRDGVWITQRKFVLGLALALRFDLIHLHHEKLISVGKNEKMEILYQYLTGTEFRHRIEAIAESFTNLQQDMEKEKRYFNIKWARQEKEIRKIVDNTHGMYGDLQAVTGRALQQIKSLELPTGEVKDKNIKASEAG